MNTKMTRKELLTAITKAIVDCEDKIINQNDNSGKILAYKEIKSLIVENIEDDLLEQARKIK